MLIEKYTETLTNPLLPEAFQFLKRKDIFAIKLFVYPGMLLQRITTQEPDDSQIEVAISALLAAVEKT